VPTVYLMELAVVQLSERERGDRLNLLANHVGPDCFRVVCKHVTSYQIVKSVSFRFVPWGARVLFCISSRLIDARGQYGPLVQGLVLEGTCPAASRTIGCLNPFAMLDAAADSEYIAGLIRRSYGQTPPTPERPWNIVLFKRLCLFLCHVPCVGPFSPCM
jgi:hypothetical protein